MFLGPIRTGSVLIGLVPAGSVLTGSVLTSVRTGSVLTSFRTGSVRTDSLLYALLSVSLLTQEIYLAYQIIMRVLHGMCHGRAPSGNDQLPKVVLHNY